MSIWANFLEIISVYGYLLPINISKRFSFFCFFVFFFLSLSLSSCSIKILKNTPIPNKSGSCGIKVGVCIPYKSGLHAIKSVKVPLFYRRAGDFTPHEPSCCGIPSWHIFADRRGGGRRICFQSMGFAERKFKQWGGVP